MASGNGNAQAFFQTPNPQYGAAISYRLAAAGQTVRLSIVDAIGDTIATIPNAPSGVGLHTVNWGFNGMRAVVAARAPLSPSERRDSILRAVRAPMVLDSLQRAGYDSATLAQARAALNPQLVGAGGDGPGGRGGGGGGGGGGRGAGGCERPLSQFDEFRARPGEGAAGWWRTWRWRWWWWTWW